MLPGGRKQRKGKSKRCCAICVTPGWRAAIWQDRHWEEWTFEYRRSLHRKAFIGFDQHRKKKKHTQKKGITMSHLS